MIIFWSIIFIVSLIFLIKSADWLIEGAEKIALHFNISPFIIGVSVIALGTTLPELATAVSAVLKNNTEFVVDVAFGSSIATIFLIVGIISIFGKKLKVTRSLINLDAPLLLLSTILISFMAIDGRIVFGEGLILMIGFIIYIFYTIFEKYPMGDVQINEDNVSENKNIESLLTRIERKVKLIIKRDSEKEKIDFKTFIFLILGIIGLAISSNYVVESVINLGFLLKVGTSFITVFAVAIGTSLPELIVSIKAVVNKKYEMALGNIFGSNIFVIFLVIGLPALIKPLSINETTLMIGLPYLIAATLIFIISGISRKIYIWDGLMYVLIFVLFLFQYISFS
jgi:cation:H+ antiporter